MPVQRSAVPRAVSSESRFNKRFWVVVGLLVTAALAGVASLVAQVARSTPEPVTAPEIYFQPEATIAARAYLDGVAPPFAVATGVGDALVPDAELAAGRPTGDDPARGPIPHRDLTWLDAELIFVPYGQDDHRAVEIHRFLVGTDAAPFVLTVSMVEAVRDGVSTPALGAVPSLAAYDPQRDVPAVDPLDWDVVYETEAAPEALEGRIGEWAEAYATDDRRTLLELTADQRNGVEYVGLGGWSASEIDVGGVFRRPDGLSGVHVEVTLTSGDDDAVSTTASFDLLVDNAAASLPEIVAWGAAGTALELAPHENAVTSTGATTTTTAATR
jgi:hypothetical protein